MPGGRNAVGIGGWVIFAPIALLLATLVVGRRAVRAVSPWRAYLASTTTEQRRADRALDLRNSSPWVLGLVGVASAAVLAVVAATFAGMPSGPMRNPTGFVVVLQAGILLLMIAAGCLGLAFRIARSRRDLPPSR